MDVGALLITDKSPRSEGLRHLLILVFLDEYVAPDLLLRAFCYFDLAMRKKWMTSGLSKDDGRFFLSFFKSFYLIEEVKKNVYRVLKDFKCFDTDFSVRIKESRNKTQTYVII